MSALSLTLTCIGGGVAGYVAAAWPRISCRLGVHGPFVYELQARLFTGGEQHTTTRITCKRCGKLLRVDRSTR